MAVTVETAAAIARKLPAPFSGIARLSIEPRKLLRLALLQEGSLASNARTEGRLRPDHPLRAIRALMVELLTAIERKLTALSSGIGRPSIAPQTLFGAMPLQASARCFPNAS